MRRDFFARNLGSGPEDANAFRIVFYLIKWKGIFWTKLETRIWKWPKRKNLLQLGLVLHHRNVRLAAIQKKVVIMTFRTASEMLLVKRPPARPSTETDSYCTWLELEEDNLWNVIVKETISHLCFSWRRTASEMSLVKRPLARPTTDTDSSYLCLSWRRTSSDMSLVKRLLARPTSETDSYLCLNWRRGWPLKCHWWRDRMRGPLLRLTHTGAWVGGGQPLKCH